MVEVFFKAFICFVMESNAEERLRIMKKAGLPKLERAVGLDSNEKKLDAGRVKEEG